MNTPEFWRTSTSLHSKHMSDCDSMATSWCRAAVKLKFENEGFLSVIPRIRNRDLQRLRKYRYLFSRHGLIDGVQKNSSKNYRIPMEFKTWILRIHGISKEFGTPRNYENYKFSCNPRVEHVTYYCPSTCDFICPSREVTAFRHKFADSTPLGGQCSVTLSIHGVDSFM